MARGMRKLFALNEAVIETFIAGPESPSSSTTYRERNRGFGPSTTLGNSQDMNRRTFLTTTGSIASTTVAGCAGGGDGGSASGGSEIVETADVAMVGSQFDPRNIHVPAGATVRWTNENSAAHTVTNASDNWSFDAEVSGGDTAEFTFEESGVYDVYCRFHGSTDLTGMSMKVGVGDATIEEPLGAGRSSSGGSDPYG